MKSVCRLDILLQSMEVVAESGSSFAFPLTHGASLAIFASYTSWQVLHFCHSLAKMLRKVESRRQRQVPAMTASSSSISSW